MDEQFETRPLIDRDTLHSLQRRRGVVSALKLAVHLGVIVLLTAVLATGWLPIWVSLVVVVALAGAMATAFAPFHEATHRSLFTSRRANLITTWITGTLFQLPPTTYRVFHFEHHRHTQNPERDPELMGDADAWSSWPRSKTGWIKLIPVHLLWLKFNTMFRLAFLPESQWLGFGVWTSAEERRACTPESRIVLLFWALVVVAALAGVTGAAWFLAASLLSNTFIGIWLTTEHRGLPYEGTIMARTRTTESNAFVRWWLWNANYHAEHHAWPGIPWHGLPSTHELVRDHLEHHVKGYAPVHVNVLNQCNLPTCDATVD